MSEVPGTSGERTLPKNTARKSTPCSLCVAAAQSPVPYEGASQEARNTASGVGGQLS